MNTLEYINKRIEEGSANEIVSKIDWNKAMVKNPMPFLKQSIKEPLLLDDDYNFAITYVNDVLNKHKNVKIIYKKDINPTIYRHSGGTHDGTLLFSLQSIVELFKTLFDASSYKIGETPENYNLDENVWWDYDVIYFVSDMLWNIKHVDHVDEKHGKMFPGSNDEMVMAVEIVYTKNTIK